MRALLCALGLLLTTAALMEFTAQAWAEAPGPSTPAQSELRAAARDALVCPGMHAEWIDAQTVQCLKEYP